MYSVWNVYDEGSVSLQCIFRTYLSQNFFYHTIAYLFLSHIFKHLYIDVKINITSFINIFLQAFGFKEVESMPCF